MTLGVRDVRTDTICRKDSRVHRDGIVDWVVMKPGSYSISYEERAAAASERVRVVFEFSAVHLS